MDIRKAIDVVTKLYETPFMIDDQGTPDSNTLALIRKHPTRELVTKNGIRIMYSDFGGGNGSLFATDDDNGHLVYYMKFTTNNHRVLGRIITQTNLWRAKDEHMKGFPQKVLFDVLLKSFDTVMSDQHQTPEGRRFWERCISDAAVRGITVGMIDGENLTIYKSGNFSQWLSSLDPWGDEINVHENRRLFISRKRVTSTVPAA